MSNKNFNSVDDAKSYLEQLQSKLNEYTDLESHLSLELEKQNNNINQMLELQKSQRVTNYEIWSNMGILQREVEPLESENNVALEDILKDIL